MITDLILYAEAFTDGKWKLVMYCPDTDTLSIVNEVPHFENENEEQMTFEAADRLREKRKEHYKLIKPYLIRAPWKYCLCSVLGDVENASLFTPIALPRNFPEDMSPELKEIWDFNSYYYFDTMADSWVSTKEVLEYDFFDVVKEKPYYFPEWYILECLDDRHMLDCNRLDTSKWNGVPPLPVTRQIPFYPYEMDKDVNYIFKFAEWRERYAYSKTSRGNIYVEVDIPHRPFTPEDPGLNMLLNVSRALERDFSGGRFVFTFEF